MVAHTEVRGPQVFLWLCFLTALRRLSPIFLKKTRNCKSGLGAGTVEGRADLRSSYALEIPYLLRGVYRLSRWMCEILLVCGEVLS
jgi:hypothetical protein